jgi:pimeloyl-ACP methyl ester carboxylesterase
MKKFAKYHNRHPYRPVTHLTWLFSIILWGALTLTGYAETRKVTLSADGTPIAYEIHGSGNPTLVLVHGWSCDSRYWQQQIEPLSQKYRVVVLDLAGHGHSGFDRSRYSMKAFGEDVRAVLNAAGGDDFILVGHSMGGSVIVQAAQGAKQRILGLIGVDTFQNVEPMPPEALAEMTAPLRQHFRTGCRSFVASMINESTPPDLREWILADMSSAPPAVAMSAMDEMMALFSDGEAAAIFKEVRLPVVALNADLWPTDVKANRRHMVSFKLMTFPGGDHFLMLNQPDLFNNNLIQAIDQLNKH